MISMATTFKEQMLNFTKQIDNKINRAASYSG